MFLVKIYSKYNVFKEDAKKQIKYLSDLIKDSMIFPYNLVKKRLIN